MANANGGVTTEDLLSGGGATPANTLDDGSYDYFGIKNIQHTGVWYEDSTPGESSSRAIAAGYKQPATTSIRSTSPQQMLDKFAVMAQTNPDAFIALQQELYAANAYSGTPQWGVFTVADGKAMSNALTAYSFTIKAGAGITFADYLDKASATAGANGQGAGGGGGGGGARRAPIQLTSTATLQEASKTQGQSELGRETNAAEQAAYVGAYHGKEQAAYNGSTEQPGDVSSEAKNFIDKNNNAEMQTHLQAGYAASILSLLGVQ